MKICKQKLSNDPGADHFCSICARPLLGLREQEHHLIPRALGGRETVTLHAICHQKIHSVFTERELQKYYHTADRILENPDMQKFVAWVRKKSPEFYDVSRQTQRRRRK
jgi:5-methylcytosine-specific restriction endonuclease McrA